VLYYVASDSFFFDDSEARGEVGNSRGDRVGRGNRVHFEEKVTGKELGTQRSMNRQNHAGGCLLQAGVEVTRQRGSGERERERVGRLEVEGEKESVGGVTQRE
jgi:hypothetical protein